jgi:hypothetical protein
VLKSLAPERCGGLPQQAEHFLTRQPTPKTQQVSTRPFLRRWPPTQRRSNLRCGTRIAVSSKYGPERLRVQAGRWSGAKGEGAGACLVRPPWLDFS